MINKKHLLSAAFIFACALAYGLLARLLFAAEVFQPYFTIVSWSFIFVVPFAFGALITYLGIRSFGHSIFWERGAPAIVVLLGIVLAIITHLEAIMCVVVAAPLMVPVPVLGGIFMAWLMKKRSGRVEVTLLALLPLAVSPLEQLWKHPHQTVRIEDVVEIKAAPETIWREIVSVRAIERAELPSQLIYWLDFPRPISAEIDREGVGARRQARFERGVSFFEEVTHWDENKELAFTIVADPAFIPHTAFDQHIIVGGRFYDVLDGRYLIERTDSGCRLRLASHHRLSTPFNAYAGWWSEWVMRQIQGSILQVIKHRCEHPSP